MHESHIIQPLLTLRLFTKEERNLKYSLRPTIGHPVKKNTLLYRVMKQWQQNSHSQAMPPNLSVTK